MKLLGLILILLSQPGLTEEAKLSINDGSGLNPILPKPIESVIPTIEIASAIGWPEGKMPSPAPGIKVTSFAKD